MNCKQFQNKISEISLSDLRDSLPEDIRDHIKTCPVCADELQNSIGLGSILDEMKAPEKGEEFWDGYLSTVMERTVRAEKKTQWSHFPVFGKKFVIPVFAVAAIMLVFLISDTFFNNVNDEEIYSSTLDFILEEHDLESSQYMFNQSSVYLADEIIPENWGDSRSKDQKN
ncbi:hypothetical protein ACFL6O_00875 [candidate division KSB1 bacterium]